MNRRAWARKKYGEGDPPRICVGCRKAIDIMRGATSKYCSTDCRYRHKRRAWQEHDIPAAEIDRLFELEAARKRALRWRAVA